MWTYERKLQYPVKIKTPNPALAKVILTQFGGPNTKKDILSKSLGNCYTRERKHIITDALLPDKNIKTCSSLNRRL